MFDLNLSVPNITASKYTVDNRFLLLKNYLCELNETLSFALANKTESQISAFRKEMESNNSSYKKNVIQLQSQNVAKFNELKEKIINTANEIEESYTSEIEKTEKEILTTVEKDYVTKSGYSEYENTVNTKFQQTAEKISLLSENTEDVRTDLNNFKESSGSQLTVQANAVMSQVEKSFLSKNQAQELENRISSQITQTENVITENFTKEISALTEDISTVGGNISELISDLDVYIRRGELETGVYGIEIGRNDSNIKARFTNDRLSFYQGLSEVAYISGSSLYITNADILDYLRIGNTLNGYFLFDTTSNGLEVRWIDAN